MPTLSDLRSRYAEFSGDPVQRGDADEVLIADSRSRLSPAQVVEQKLRRALASREPAAAPLANRVRRPK
jgi:hypothetical protein